MHRHQEILCMHSAEYQPMQVYMHAETLRASNGLFICIYKEYKHYGHSACSATVLNSSDMIAIAIYNPHLFTPSLLGVWNRTCLGLPSNWLNNSSGKFLRGLMLYTPCCLHHCHASWLPPFLPSCTCIVLCTSRMARV